MLAAVTMARWYTSKQNIRSDYKPLQQDMLDELVSYGVVQGFHHAHALEAAQYASTKESLLGTHRHLLSFSCLSADWLLVHVPESDLPSPYRVAVDATAVQHTTGKSRETCVCLLTLLYVVRIDCLFLS